MNLQGKTISVYVTGPFAEALGVAIEKAAVKPSQWGASAFYEKLEREGLLPDQISSEERAMQAARSAVEALGAESFIEELGNLLKRNYESKGAA